MASDDFMTSILSQFKDKLVKESEVSLLQHLKQYKEELGKLGEANKKLFDETMKDYRVKRDKLNNTLTSTVNKMVSNNETKINKKIADVTNDMETRLAKIDDELFIQPNTLYQKILNATKELKNQREAFTKERKLWTADDKRCAAWLGISYETDDDSKDDDSKDDEEPANNSSKDNKPQPEISDDDFIVVKVDDRTFRTYRGTLTQIKGSFMAKLFGPHSHLIHRDLDGSYCLNCNADVFGHVLEILRKRGTVPLDFKMTHTLYAALMEYGILEVFFPAFNPSELGLSNMKNAKQIYHVVFESWRSTSWESNYIRWNVQHLSNVKLDSSDEKDDEKKDTPDTTYWQLNPNDNSELIIKVDGLYRIVFRCCVSDSSGHVYAQVRVNGSSKQVCRHYNESTNRYKSYNLNEIGQYKKNDKIKILFDKTAYDEAKGSYFCIERIPDAIVDAVGVWESASTDSDYRQWTSAVKGSDRCTLANSNKNVVIQRGGLYRISARIHTYHASAGNANTSLYENRNGSNHTLHNYQANNKASSLWECHMYDKIVSFKKSDYVMMYDGGYKTVSNATADSISVQPVLFSHLVGHWGSSSVKDTYYRKWNFELWGSEILYKLDDDQVHIQVKERGYYRISAHLTNYQPNEDGYTSLYVNDQEYAISRMGCYTGTTLYHTTSIQEIVSLNERDTLSVYSSKPYTGSKDYNQFWIEKLL